MQITEGQLRRMIREALLVEAAKTPKDIVDMGIQIEVSPGDDYVDIRANQVRDDGSSTRVANFGSHLTRTSPHSPAGPCSGAYSIYWSKSKIDGLGPLLYDLMIDLVHPHPLTSDRESVSQDAKRVWDYYSKLRYDIDEEQLDDMRNTLTDDPDDNCWQASAAAWDGDETWPNSSLSKAYSRAEGGTPLLDELWELGVLKFTKSHPRFARYTSGHEQEDQGETPQISEGQLRRMVREELESASGDYAIATLGNTSTGPVYVIAYDTNKLEASLRTEREGGAATDYNGVIAGVTLKRSGEHGECNGSWHVTSSASNERGWGTRVYLAALDFLRNISSDRISVTPAAENLWKKLGKSQFVYREEFDDIKNPKTPPESDDCRMFLARDPILNSSIRLDGSIPNDVKDLVDIGDHHFRELGRNYMRHEAEMHLRRSYGELFVNMYDT